MRQNFRLREHGYVKGSEVQDKNRPQFLYHALTETNVMYLCIHARDDDTSVVSSCTMDPNFGKKQKLFWDSISGCNMHFAMIFNIDSSSVSCLASAKHDMSWNNPTQWPSEGLANQKHKKEVLHGGVCPHTGLFQGGNYPDCNYDYLRALISLGKEFSFKPTTDPRIQNCGGMTYNREAIQRLKSTERWKASDRTDFAGETRAEPSNSFCNNSHSCAEAAENKNTSHNEVLTMIKVLRVSDDLVRVPGLECLCYKGGEGNKQTAERMAKKLWREDGSTPKVMSLEEFYSKYDTTPDKRPSTRTEGPKQRSTHQLTNASKPTQNEGEKAPGAHRNSFFYEDDGTIKIYTGDHIDEQQRAAEKALCLLLSKPQK